MYCAGEYTKPKPKPKPNPNPIVPCALMANQDAQLEELEALTAIYASNFLPDSHADGSPEELGATAKADVELPEDGLMLEASHPESLC